MADFSFDLEYGGVKFDFEVEGIYNEILNEAYYSVSMGDYPSFVMAWDIDKGRLVRQGSASYLVYELEDAISRKIEEHYLEV